MGKIVELNRTTIFIAGVYVTGKSTMCSALSKELHIPAFSASDLISSFNGEQYGANKTVSDKNNNQLLLSKRVHQLSKEHGNIILAGHFCIFDSNDEVDILPESVFPTLNISQIILLESDVQKIISNLRHRDGRVYSETSISILVKKEQEQSKHIAKRLNCLLSIYQMTFTDQDVKQIAALINQGE